MSKLLSKAGEELLLAAVRKSIDLVDDNGYSPNAALEKVALEYSLQPELIKRAAEAYNTGRTAHQRETNKNILDKLASFELMSSEEVLAKLYPAKVEKKANALVDAIYSQPPKTHNAYAVSYRQQLLQTPLKYTEKVASGAEETNKKLTPVQIFNKLQGYKESVEKTRTAAGQAKDSFAAAVGVLGDYFKQSQLYRLPFNVVRHNAAALFGKAAEELMDYVETRNKISAKREGGYLEDYRKPVDKTKAPYSYVNDCLQKAAAAKEAVIQLQKNQENWEKLAAELTAEPVVEPFSILSTEKKADIFSAALGGLATTTLRPDLFITPTDKLISKYQTKLDEPAHDNEIRAIRARAMLTDFINNDEIISGYPADQVLEAYNNISKLSPRASTQPAVIRPLLRKWLVQGAIEPFEVAEMANIEKTLVQTERAPFGLQNSFSEDSRQGAR